MCLALAAAISAAADQAGVGRIKSEAFSRKSKVEFCIFFT